MTTKNASNKVTATPMKAAAAVTIKHGDAIVQNDSAVTWNEGENTVTVQVQYGTAKSMYTVKVTKATA